MRERFYQNIHSYCPVYSRRQPCQGGNWGHITDKNFTIFGVRIIIQLMLDKKTTTKYAALAAFVLAISAFALWFGIFVSENDVTQSLVSQYGYLGALILGIVSGFNFIVPIPAAAFVPTFRAAGESALLATMIITVGMTIGDLVGYFIGKTGRMVMLPDDHRVKIGYFDKIKERYHSAPLLLLFLFASFVPLPNELLVAPMAFLGYMIKHIFPITLAGNLVFNTIASLAFLGIFEGIR